MSRSTHFFLVRMTNWKSSWCKTFDKFHVCDEVDGNDDDSSSNALCWNGKRSFEERGWQRPQQFEEHQRRRGMDRKLAMDDAPQNFGWILLLTKVPKIHPIWYSHPSLKHSWIISLFMIHLISHAQHTWCSLLHPFNPFFHQRCVMSGHHHYALEERKDVIISNSKAFASNWLPWGTCRKVLQNYKLTVNLI